MIFHGLPDTDEGFKVEVEDRNMPSLYFSQGNCS